MSESTISIVFNAEKMAIAADSKVQAVIEQAEITGNRFIIVLNDEILPKSQYQLTLLNAGDVIDVVAPISGG